MNIFTYILIKLIKCYKFLISPLFGNLVDIFLHVQNIVLKL